MEDIKEKTADEMFEELGYEKEERSKSDIYIKQYEYFTRQFGFNKPTKNIMIDVEYINMQELQAINKKCQELRLVRR